MGCEILKLGLVTLTTSLLETVVTDRLEHAMTNQSTKYEVPSFTHYGNTKGFQNVENGVVSGG